MHIKCPHGRMNLLVQVLEGICDAPDLCRFKKCDFYDTSKEATLKFLTALAHEQTLEGLWKKQLSESSQDCHLAKQHLVV